MVRCWTLWQHPSVVEVTDPNVDEVRILFRRLYLHPLTIIAMTQCPNSYFQNCLPSKQHLPPGMYEYDGSLPSELSSISVESWNLFTAAVNDEAKRIIGAPWLVLFFCLVFMYATIPLFQEFDKMDGEHSTQEWMLLWMLLWMIIGLGIFILPLLRSHAVNMSRIAAPQSIVEQEQARFEALGFYTDFRREHRSDTPGLLVLVRFRPILGILTTPFRAIA